jgi:triosephosphate isomerase
MIPILCLGASVHSHNYRWLKNILNKIKNFNTIIVAYEPIWAIGTGITPSLKDIESVADIISDQYPCLYGGSVNEHNINDIMQIKNLSGVMVGKASIESFNLILQ